MVRLEKYYREKTGNKNSVLKRDVRIALGIAESYAEEYAKEYLASKVSKLDLATVITKLKELDRFDIEPYIDDYNEYTEARISEGKSENGEWVKWYYIDRIINFL